MVKALVFHSFHNPSDGRSARECPGQKKRPNKSAASVTTYPSAGAPAKLMVGGGAVAVRSCDCNSSDSDTDDNCGANGHAADERGAQWRWCDWRWSWLSCSGLGESLCRNQGQDSSGSENFFHDKSLFFNLSEQKLVHCCFRIITIHKEIAPTFCESDGGRLNCMSD
jgi:hypothetical protein